MANCQSELCKSAVVCGGILEDNRGFGTRRAFLWMTLATLLATADGQALAMQVPYQLL